MEFYASIGMPLEQRAPIYISSFTTSGGISDSRKEPRTHNQIANQHKDILSSIKTVQSHTKEREKDIGTNKQQQL